MGRFLGMVCYFSWPFAKVGSGRQQYNVFGAVESQTKELISVRGTDNINAIKVTPRDLSFVGVQIVHHHAEPLVQACPDYLIHQPDGVGGFARRVDPCGRLSGGRIHGGQKGARPAANALDAPRLRLPRVQRRYRVCGPRPVSRSSRPCTARRRFREGSYRGRQSPVVSPRTAGSG